MKQNGFTLIELLAVIVILAIIALIAIPMISKIIDKTEDSAAIRSAELYIDGVNQAIMKANLNQKLRPKECIIQEDGNLICDKEHKIIIEATGTKPNTGVLIIEDRKVKDISSMIIDRYELGTDDKGNIVVIRVLEDDEEPEDYVDKAGVIVNLPESLTPVIYIENNWKVADLKKPWYNYTRQEWANAVILKSGIEKNVGDIVDVSSEVQAMFVWIPRYEYKIDGTYGVYTNGALGTASIPGKIDVNFIGIDRLTASDGYIIHPAFTFGTQQLSGIWVGKFETTGTATDPTILPNLTSLRTQNINGQFTTAQLFKTYINDSSIDAHMSKNSEWGAVSYLSQSKYGKYGNVNYSGEARGVMINNCSNYITGISANSFSEASNTVNCTTNTYETPKGQAASTTGNITGIYDMSGGAYEYVMGVYNKTVGSSGISTWPDAKYYDNYNSTTITKACNSGICYGHALSETQGWYNDHHSFLTTSYVWLVRGDYHNGMTNAGMFSFTYGNGANTGNAFRVVLVKS